MGTTATRRTTVLGVDIGSTNTKVVALDREGHVVARVRRRTPRNADDPSVDADQLFEAIEDMILEVCGDQLSVRAVCAAGIGEDGVLTDAGLRPLTRALAWFDPRRQDIYQTLAPQLGPADDVGVDSDPARTVVGWTWACAQPGTETATGWLALTDFASARWAGTPFLSDTLAARTAAWHTTARTWITSRVTATLGTTDLLPPVIRTGDLIGLLRSARLAEAGVLEPEAMVVAGGHDHPVGGWGVGLLDGGAVLDSMGTAEVVTTQSRSKAPDPGDGLDSAAGICQNGTTVLRVEELDRNVKWARQDAAVSAALDELISGDQQPDGYLTSGTFLPGAAGGQLPRYTADAPGAPASRAAAVLGALAELGGRAINSVSGYAEPGTQVFTAGGWSRSPGWVAIKQAVTQRRATLISEPEVTATGAALLAAHAIGWAPDPATAFAPVPAAQAV
ncbi:FGGY family carbohydrate kinase [Streptomyces sp. NPDC102384]|uniref:FGGY family carbohydrate kinase n=1 Tax=Streptomyces sp. NPDC102384 TaxID=3366166 RepID=UPI0037FCC7DB